MNATDNNLEAAVATRPSPGAKPGQDDDMSHDVKLIRPWEAITIRRSDIGKIPGCGAVAAMDGSGRATCRVCGKKIRKGSPALVTVYDFGGGCLAGDPWTGVEIWIHAEPCQPGGE